MTLAASGSDALIGEFGENVTVTEKVDNEFEDPDDPIFHKGPSENEGKSTEHKVRLYTTPSKETLEDYGFDEDTDSMMYSTDDIAESGDTVEYDPGNYEWVVGEISTSQIGEGPYLFVYQLIRK